MIIIKEIDEQNVFDVCELTTNKNGLGTVMEEYICCNATSIAESKYYLEMHPKAIYNDDNLIGFFMYKQIDEKPSIAIICRFMIDYKYQNKGLGRKAFQAILDFFLNNGITKIILMIDKENKVAKKLYESFNFTFTGKVEKGEYYYQLEL